MGAISSKQTKITFHDNHGQDIELGDDSAAVRVENRATSWSSGSVFSSEPIKINQKIYVRLVVVSRASHDVISVGFTSTNPSDLTETQTEKDCTCTLSKYFCSEDSIVCFYVSNSGTLYYGKSNGTYYKVWNKKVDLSGPVWAVFHIWSEPTTIRLISQTEAKQSVFRAQNVDANNLGEDVRRKVTKDTWALTDSSHQDDDTCVICCTNDIEVVFVPCGHLCSCFQCGQTIEHKDNLCPICRKRIDSVVRVYRS